MLATAESAAPRASPTVVATELAAVQHLTGARCVIAQHLLLLDGLREDLPRTGELETGFVVWSLQDPG